MNSYRKIVCKELKNQKLTSILIIIAIVLSTLMTTVIGQSIGILNAMRIQQAISLNGNRYATFHQLNINTAKDLKKDNSLEFAGLFINIGISEIKESGLSLYLTEYKGDAISSYGNTYQLNEGRLPENKNEIALPENVISLLGKNIKVGDIINLPMEISLLKDTEEPYQFSQQFLLTGIVNSNYIGYVSGTIAGIVGEGTAENILPEKYMVYSVDVRTKEKSAFQNVIYSLEKKYAISDSQVQYNDTLLSTMGIKYDSGGENDFGSGFSYMALSGVIVGALVLITAGLVIFNILKISVSKKIKQYGVLRAVGATKGKLYELVSLQLLILCGIGMPIGVIAGTLSAKGITKIATQVFSSEMFMVSSKQQLERLIDANSETNLWVLTLSIVITVLFAILAALPAAYMASKVSPVLAMSGNVLKITRKNRKIKKIHNFEIFYARINMMRNKGRTVLTILSLVMSIAVFIALQGFSGLLDTSSNIQKMHLGDYSITNEQTGISPELVGKLTKTQGVEQVFTLKYKLYGLDKNNIPVGIETDISLQPGETLQICGIDESRFNEISPKNSRIEEKLKNGDGCIVKLPIMFGDHEKVYGSVSYNQGDNITVNGKKLEILAITDEAITLDNQGFTNGLQLIVTDNVFTAITGEENYTEVYPVLSDNADRNIIESAIEQICSDSTGSRCLSYKETDKQLEESYTQIKLLAWGVIFFVGLIGILNIINTVYTNIHTRLGELGIQRAIGMNMGSFYKTFLWEGMFYGIIATVIGSVIGYICILFIDAAANEVFKITSFPFLSAFEAAFIFIGACLVATLLPLLRVSKMNIVECIEIIE